MLKVDALVMTVMLVSTVRYLVEAETGAADTAFATMREDASVTKDMLVTGVSTLAQEKVPAVATETARLWERASAIPVTTVRPVPRCAVNTDLVFTEDVSVSHAL